MEVFGVFLFHFLTDDDGDHSVVFDAYLEIKRSNLTRPEAHRLCLRLAAQCYISHYWQNTHLILRLSCVQANFFVGNVGTLF